MIGLGNIRLFLPSILCAARAILAFGDVRGQWLTVAFLTGLAVAFAVAERERKARRVRGR